MDEQTTPAFDWRGKTITVGSLVVYPTAQGSASAGVIESKVVEIIPCTRERWCTKPPFKLRVEHVRSAPAHNAVPGKLVVISNTDRVTVVG